MAALVMPQFRRRAREPAAHYLAPDFLGEVAGRHVTKSGGVGLGDMPQLRQIAVIDVRQLVSVDLEGDADGGHGSTLQRQRQAAQGGQRLNGLAACARHIGRGLAQVKHSHIQRIVRIGMQLDGVGRAHGGGRGGSAAAGLVGDGHGLDSWLNQGNHPHAV